MQVFNSTFRCVSSQTCNLYAMKPLDISLAQMTKQILCCFFIAVKLILDKNASFYSVFASCGFSEVDVRPRYNCSVCIETVPPPLQLEISSLALRRHCHWMAICAKFKYQEWENTSSSCLNHLCTGLTILKTLLQRLVGFSFLFNVLIDQSVIFCHEIQLLTYYNIKIWS